MMVVLYHVEMRCSRCLRGPFRVKYVAPHEMPRPCTPRWDLRLAKARLWDERIDADEKTAWQVEDERHMSPEYNEFLGYPTRRMKPGMEGEHTPDSQFEKKLPNQSAYELMARRDVPYQDNIMWGKRLHDETTYGMAVPYSYYLFKQMQKASRNDRKTKQNKFKIFSGGGIRNAPSGYTPQADPEEEDTK
jgi:hypothetical protein